MLPDESGTVIRGMDTEDKSVHEGTITYDIRFRAIVPGTAWPRAAPRVWQKLL